MKKKTIAFFAALSLSFAGMGMATLSAAAQTEDPTIEIVAHTLSLNETVHIKYAVAGDALETDKLGLLIWSEPQESYEYGGQTESVELLETATIDGVEYPAFRYEGLAAKQMTDTVYARAYVEREGEYYYSEVDKYSVLEYAYNKLGKTESTPTDDEGLELLLNSLLAYGAAAQEYFGYKTDALATDEFVYARIENATFADGFSYGLFKAGTTHEVTPAAGYELGEQAEEYLSVGESGEILFTVPQTKTVDTTSFVKITEEEEEGTEGLEYTLSEDGTYYSVTGYTGTATDVVIPSKYEGLPVKKIGDYAFDSCSSLTSVAIPDSVTSIGEYAFWCCYGLTEIVIPDSVTSIGRGAFSDCSSLTEIVIPDSVTSIDGGAFSNCSSLTEIVIPDGVTSIGDGAFMGCNSLTSVVIGDSVTSIGWGAFEGCSSLTSVVIGDSVTGIGEGAFRECSSLTSVVIGNGVTSVGVEAFCGCSSLTEIVIPDSVTSIGDSAFAYCDSLTEIVIPDSVTSIGWGAFEGCSSLTSVVIGDGVTSTGDATFRGCSSLTEIVIPDGVTGIGKEAFSGCSSLTEIVISNSVTSIGSYAFKDCINLTIYCEAESQLEGWSSDWNSSGYPVYWYSESEPTEEENFWHYMDGVVTVWTKESV